MTPLDMHPSACPNEPSLELSGADPSAFVSVSPDGGHRLDLLIQNVSCPGCIAKIESVVSGIDPSVSARMNLSTKRLSVTWSNPALVPSQITGALENQGYVCIPFNGDALADATGAREKTLLKALGVAGFAWANVMLLSVSVWAGAVSDMDAVTRDFFHWVSALIALPAIGYAGQPFFKSAWAAIAARRMNMDVPISLAVLLAAGASVWQASISGPHAYFDAALMLLFFLLVGRYLDERSRAKVGTSAQNLLALQTVSASLVLPDGRIAARPADVLKPGDIVRVVPGDRIPADGVVIEGGSEVDASLISGEADPINVLAGGGCIRRYFGPERRDQGARHGGAIRHLP